MSNTMLLSVVMPARNEQRLLPGTVSAVIEVLEPAGIPHELVIVDDYSTDETAQVALELAARWPAVHLVANALAPGVGCAIQSGLARATGEAVAIIMADGSDHPADLVAYYRTLQGGCDCVFGSRFIRGARVTGYPWHKLILNRLANGFIQALFWLPYNDVTNAFKCYRRDVIDGAQPLLSHHFNIMVELPLKAIVRGYSYTVIPIRWQQRQHGLSKLKIREMGSRYLFIILYLWMEKYLSRGDYRRRSGMSHKEDHDRCAFS